MPLVLNNPVVDAYIRGVNERRQDVQTQFENQMQQQAGQRAEQQLQAYIKNLDAEQKHRTAQIDLENQRVALERQSHELQARQLVTQMISTGMQKPPTEAQANSSPVGGIPIGGGEVLDPRTIRTPQEMADLEAQRATKLGEVQANVAGRVAGSQAEALEPYKRFQRISEHQQEMEKQLLVGQQTLERTNKEIEGRKAVARIEGQYGLDRARIQMFGGIGGESGPMDWAQTVLPYTIGTAQKPLGNTPRDIMIRQHINALGAQEFTAKDAEKLGQLAALAPITDLQKEFVTKFAPNGNIEAAGQILMSKLPTTDLNNFKARLRSAGGQLAKAVDAQTGRMANQEIERFLGGLALPGKTLSQAIQDFQFYRSRIGSQALDGVMGSLPDKQKLLILRTRGLDPNDFNKVIDYKGKKGYLFKQAPDGEWGYFDQNTGTYKSIGDK